MRIGAVVDAVDVARGLEQDRHPQRGRPRGHEQRHHEAVERASGSAHGEGEDERPDEVPLLLDRQRPEVLQQRRAPQRLEVALAVDDVPPVGDVEQGGDGVAAQAVEGVGHAQYRPRAHRDQHHVQRGQKPSAPAQPELPAVDSAGSTPLLDHERRDEVAADDEEDVDPEEPSGDPGELEVEQHHGGDGERPHAVESGPVPHRRSGRGLASRSRGRGIGGRDVVVTVVGIVVNRVLGGADPWETIHCGARATAWLGHLRLHRHPGFDATAAPPRRGVSGRARAASPPSALGLDGQRAPRPRPTPTPVSPPSGRAPMR